MKNLKILEGKRLLIVDDEEDVLETLKDCFDTCVIDFARYFQDAQELFNRNEYDVAIFDIMGVKGYDLLEIAGKKDIPAIMLTAHALSPDHFFKSIDGGAKAYIPKEKMSELTLYAAEILKDHYKGVERPKKWFARLRSFFDSRFGRNWMENPEDKDQFGWLVDLRY